MLRVAGIWAQYGQTPVLQEVTLKVEDGSASVVLGRNGVGKTTLIRTIIGFTPTTRGSIFLRGADVTHWPSYRRVRSGVGLVPQGRRIFSSLSVLENLMVAMVPKENGWNMDKVFTLFPRLKERMNQLGGTLSGGEQQMLAIGRGLMSNPELLLLDEPSEGLSPTMVRELSLTLGQLKHSGLSMLLVEQNYGLAKKMADYVYVMVRGKIAYESSSEHMQEEEVKARYLGL